MSQNSTTSTTPRGVLGLERGIEAFVESPEFRGPVESLEGRCCNDHFALIYETEAERFTAAIPFMRQGLERGERCMYVVDAHTEDEILAAMREAGIDVDDALESGALTFHTIQDTYLRDGTFDPDRMIEFYADAIEEATAEFEALRVTAGTSWLQDDATTIEDFMAYEAKVNDLFEDEDCIALCQYDCNGFPPEVIRDIIRTHPHLIYADTVCHNFYYTPPEEFFGPERPDREVDRMMGTLLDRTRAKAALEEQGRYLRDQYDVIARPDCTFEEKLQALFDLGCKRFGLELGGMSCVDLTTDHFEIEYVSDDHDHFVPGAQVALSKTYCQTVTDDAETACVTDPVGSGFDDLVSYREFGVNTYLGTYIGLDGDFDRTFWFVSQEPRSEPFSDEDQTFLQLMGQWVKYELERKRREEQLAALNELSRDLMDTETADEVCDRIVEAAVTTLDLPVTAIALYDEWDGGFRPAAATETGATLLEEASLIEIPDGIAWEAFVEDGIKRSSEPLDVAIAAGQTDVTEVIAFPLARHGVFIVGTISDNGFSDADLEFAETVRSTAEAAFDRTYREQQLSEREAILEGQNKTLERLNRINDIIRSIDQGLVQASTRSEIESVVCEQLADVGPYELAWIGDRDAVTDEVTPREWAGNQKGYLDEIAANADEGPAGTGPASRAVRAREPRVVNDILDDPPYESWRQAALNRGYHACIALPLRYEGSLYGVLSVYAGEPGVFDDLERSVLSELSDTIAYAINAVETKKALVSDTVTELEFELTRTETSFVELTAELGCVATLESLIPQADGRIRVFFTTRGVQPTRFLEAAAGVPFSDLTLVSEREEAGEPVGLFAGIATDGSFCLAILEHGGVARKCRIDDGVGKIVIELAADGATREFVDMFRTTFPGAELVAQRTRERSRQSPTRSRESLLDSLTNRQLEVLQVAYFSGYFEEPRTNTGSDVAASLEITQPTFNHHLRAAHRKLCRGLFEKDQLGGIGGER